MAGRQSKETCSIFSFRLTVFRSALREPFLLVFLFADRGQNMFYVCLRADIGVCVRHF